MSSTLDNGSPFGLSGNFLPETVRKSSTGGLSTEKYLQLIGSWRGSLKEELVKKDTEISAVTTTEKVLLDKLCGTQKNQEAISAMTHEEISKREQFISKFVNLDDTLLVIRDHTLDMQAITNEFSKVQIIRADKRQALAQRYKDALLSLEQMRTGQDALRADAKDRLNMQYRKYTELETEALRVRNQITVHNSELKEKLFSFRPYRTRLDDLGNLMNTERSTFESLLEDAERNDMSERNNQKYLSTVREEQRSLSENIKNIRVATDKLAIAADDYSAKSLTNSSVFGSLQEKHEMLKTRIQQRQNDVSLRINHKTLRAGTLNASQDELSDQTAGHRIANGLSEQSVADTSAKLDHLRVEKAPFMATWNSVRGKATALQVGVDAENRDQAQELDVLKTEIQTLGTKQKDLDMALESINSKDEEEKARIQRLGALEDLQAKERQLRDLIDENSSYDENLSDLQRLKKESAELEQGLTDVEAEMDTSSDSRKNEEKIHQDQKNEVQKITDYLNSAKDILADKKRFVEKLSQFADLREMLSERLAQEQELTTFVNDRSAECDMVVGKGVILVKQGESSEIDLDNSKKSVKALQDAQKNTAARSKFPTSLKSPVKRQLHPQGTSPSSPAKRLSRRIDEEEVSSQVSVSDSDDSAFSLRLPKNSIIPPRNPRAQRVSAMRPSNSRMDADEESRRGYQTMDDF